MAWRETRGAWRHFLYFFACIAIGVGALVGVSLFSTNVERAVTKEARGLLGGDLEIRLTHPLSLAGQAVLDSLNGRNMASHCSSGDLVGQQPAAGHVQRPGTRRLVSDLQTTAPMRHRSQPHRLH